MSADQDRRTEPLGLCRSGARARSAFYFRPGDYVEVQPESRSGGPKPEPFQGYVTPDQPLAGALRRPDGKYRWAFVYVLSNRDRKRGYERPGGWAPEQCTLLSRESGGPSAVIGDHIVLGAE